MYPEMCRGFSSFYPLFLEKDRGLLHFEGRLYIMPIVPMCTFYCHALFQGDQEGSGLLLQEEAHNRQVVLLIPALNPDGRLIELLTALQGSWTDPIVLVDDGSDEGRREIFDRAEAMGCQVIRHARNLGKGRGLKTGFNHILTHFPDAIGCITADADGQHTPADIALCADALRADPQALVLGCRDFSQSGIPARSVFGNRVTRGFMRFLCGVAVTDTQTGLRGIPASFMSYMLDIPGERFEYETNMLLETRTAQVPIREVSIQTLYLEGNKSSHFNPLVDSFRIYALLLKFCAASVVGFVVDIAFFALFTRLFAPELFGVWTVVVCTALARIISATVNYLINRKAVFKSRQAASRSGSRYALLCVIQAALSAGLVTLCDHFLAGPLLLWKIIVDLCLFLLSFQIQRRWVF